MQSEEVKALKRLTPHPSIVDLIEVLYDAPTGKHALVFECMDMNAYELVEMLRTRQTYIPQERLKGYMYQVRAGRHVHPTAASSTALPQQTDPGRCGVCLAWKRWSELVVPPIAAAEQSVSLSSRASISISPRALVVK
jgi:hypothetical protein